MREDGGRPRPGPAHLPQAAFTQFHRVIAEELAFQPEQMLVCGTALGYADPVAVENTLVTERADVAEFVRFIED